MSSKATLLSGESKPPSLDVEENGVPGELRERSQWVCWRWSVRQDKSGSRKWTKEPVNAKTGRLADTTDPATWSSFAEAWNRYQASRGELAGIGFVFAGDDPFCGVDLDDALSAWHAGTVGQRHPRQAGQLRRGVAFRDWRQGVRERVHARRTPSHQVRDGGS